MLRETGQEPFDAVALCRAVERTEIGVGNVGTADNLLAGFGNERVDELVVHARARDHACRGRAVLARVVEPGARDARGRGLDISLVGHDARRVAAELEVHALEVGRGRRGDFHARAHASRYRHELRHRMRDERPPGIAVAAHDIERTGREELGRELRQHHCGLGRRLRRLQHDGVPGCKRGRDLPHRHHHRVVPRRHLRAHAERLAPNERCVPGHVLAAAFAFEHARGAGEEPQLVDERRDLVGRHQRGRLAGRAAFGGDEVVGTRFDRVGDPQDRPAAVGRRRRAPLGERALGRGNRVGDVVGARPGGLADRLAGAGIDQRRGATPGVDPLAGDEVLDVDHGASLSVPARM